VASVRPVEAVPLLDAAVERSRVERSKLRRELGRLDAVCLLIAAIVVMDTLGVVARGGAQTVAWLAIVAALFFVPAGLVIAELGAAFPHQGGPYVWARLAFGRYAGSLVALIYFVEAPIWVGGSLAITAVAVLDELVVPLQGGWRVLVALGFVWTTVALAVVPLRAGKRVPLAGAVAQVGLLGFFTATVVVYAARHGVHGVTVADLAPSWAVFVVVAPVLVYNFLGFELPSAAGEELRDPARDVPASILRAGVLTFALYAVPVLAIVLVVPADRLTGLTGFVDALGSVFVVYGRWAGLVGELAAVAFVWVLVANGLTWVMAISRTQAAASLGGVGPSALGRVSARTGTPLRATVTSGLVATATTLAAFAVAGDDNARYFSVVLALSIALLAVANLVVFPALVQLRRSHPQRPRPFRVPGGHAGAWIASGLATGWSALAVAATLWPGLGTADPDAYLPDGFAADRLGFTLTGLLPLAAVIAAAAAVAHYGRRQQRSAIEAAEAAPGNADERPGHVNPAVAPTKGRTDGMQTALELPEDGRSARLTPAELGKLDHPTPYLLMDLDAVERAYRAITSALPEFAIHYATKCNPDPRILARLHAAGSGFEIASYPELHTITGLGVHAEQVIFSSPVKPWTQIREAAQAGVWRFAFDSATELDKLATHAPGAAVYVRLGTGDLGSTVPSEGKFGVSRGQAVELMRYASSLGLQPYGIAYHVGSQMTEPRAWKDATRRAATVLRELQAHGITLRMLNIGGGLPARYAEPVPVLTDYGACIRQAVDRYLPYPVQLCAEPGRALVAEAGVLVATVIGTAERGGSGWLHLDVGAFNGMMETLLTRNRLVYPLADSRASPERRPYHITGPTCDSQDTMFFGVALSHGLAPGDQVYIYTAGAYTTCYASAFNGFNAPSTHCLS